MKIRNPKSEWTGDDQLSARVRPCGKVTTPHWRFRSGFPSLVAADVSRRKYRLMARTDVRGYGIWPVSLRISVFGFPSAFGIRHSDFHAAPA
jgi:hypothetical protein